MKFGAREKRAPASKLAGYGSVTADRVFAPFEIPGRLSWNNHNINTCLS